ncbi:MAG: M56 family metallopeptidase [Acidimicrobiia bacterium]
MSVALLAVGIVLLVTPGFVARWLRRLPPRDWAGLVTASLVGGLTVLEAALVTLGAPTVLRSAGWSGLARACDRMFRSVAIGGPAVGWLAALAAVGLAFAVAWGSARAVRLHRRARVEPWLGEHHQRDDYEIVLLPTAEPVAYSLGGRRPQVVLSVGLTRALTEDQLAAVVRHEQAHLRHRHGRRLVLAAAIDRTVGVVPMVRASTSSLRTALERWADEDASGSDTEARSCLRDALMAAAHAAVAPELAAFGGAQVALDRAAALALPAPSVSVVARTLTWVALAGVWLVGLSALGLWISRTRSVLAMAGYCVS